MGETKVQRYAKKLMAENPEKYPTLKEALNKATEILEAKSALERAKPAVMLLALTALTIALIQTVKEMIEEGGGLPP